MTAGDLLSRVFKRLGVLSPGESLRAEDSADALVWLNLLIDRWGTQRCTMTALLRTVKALSSGTASYTIGTGGDIAIVRPQYIDNATLIVDTTADPLTERPIDVLDRNEWARLPNKDLETGDVQAIFYDHGWSSGLARIYPWPIPNIATLSLVLYTPVAATIFADTTTTYSLPPGMESALEANLTVELAGPYGVAVTADMLSRAEDTLADFKRANTQEQLVEMSFDQGLTGVQRPSNIYTGA